MLSSNPDVFFIESASGVALSMAASPGVPTGTGDEFSVTLPL